MLSRTSSKATLALLVLLLSTVVGCVVGDDEDEDPEVDVIGAGSGVGVKNGKLVRGTSGFRPKGVTLTGLALSPAAAAANPGTVYARAYREVVQDFDAQLARYSSWGVNTLRAQVSQDALDPQSPVYDAAYLPFIMSTMQRARAAGFVVIVSMRESMPGDFADQCGADKLPCAITRRAWKQILNHPTDIGHDRRYMLEIYNEPMSSVANTDANWAIWRPPHQALLADIREMGAVNVLVADGIRAGKFMPTAGKYRLSDPLNRLAYGIHPYPLLVNNLTYYRSRDWQSAFGDFCDNGNACIATEWATGNDVACFDKTNNPNGASSPSIAAAMFRYLHDHNIGSAVWPGDYPGAIVSDWQGTLTSWGNWNTFSCSNPDQQRGMGAMMRAYYVNGTLP
jgi:hypothetical protein